MARQSGILRIKGTIGGMTFYRSQDGHMVREKGGVSGDRIASDPAFARTRENGAEFGAAGKAGKIMRDNLRPMMLNASDNRVTSRITKVMTDMLKLDTVNPRGSRSPADGLATPEGKALLKGFNFNIKSILGSVLFTGFNVDTTTGEIFFSDFVPINQLAFPAGATHVSLTSCYGKIDFTDGTANVGLSTPLNIPIDATKQNVSLMPLGPAGVGINVYLLKVEFFQMVNGLQYSLKNGAYNALSIVEVQ